MLALGLQDSLPRRPEVLHLDPHSSLTQGHQTGLGADGLDVGTGKVVFLVDELVEVNILIQGHFGGVQREDLLLGSFCEHS